MWKSPNSSCHSSLKNTFMIIQLTMIDFFEYFSFFIVSFCLIWHHCLFTKVIPHWKILLCIICILCRNFRILSVSFRITSTKSISYIVLFLHLIRTEVEEILDYLVKKCPIIKFQFLIIFCIEFKTIHWTYHFVIAFDIPNQFILWTWINHSIR